MESCTRYIGAVTFRPEMDAYREKYGSKRNHTPRARTNFLKFQLPKSGVGCDPIVGRAEKASRNAPCPCRRETDMRMPGSGNYVEEYVNGVDAADGTRPVMVPRKAKRCCRSDAPIAQPIYPLEGQS